jgi:hypothetical protein
LGLQGVVMAEALKYSHGYSGAALEVERVSQRVLGLPFDLARCHYARAVRAGLIEQSMLGWAKFEQTLVALEMLTLGPWARRV